jgi:hypothetical protein
MTDAEILTLVHQLESCQLAAAHFHHRDHIAVAVAFLYGADFETALDRMRAALLKFTAFHGVTLYHETMTRFWMMQANRFVNQKSCLKESVAQAQTALSNSNLIYDFYSKERLGAAEAKEKWLEPDKKNLVSG